MKISFLTIGDKNYPSSRYRGYYWFKELKYLNLDVEINPVGGKRYVFNVIYEFLRLLSFKKRIIYIQKINHPLIRLLAKLNKLKRNKIIFDFDDSIFILDDKNTKNMIKISDAIVVSNSYLRDYAKKYNKNVYVVSTSIDIKGIGKLRKSYRKENERIIIGWIGSESTLDYLYEIEEVLINLNKRYGLELRIIGPQDSMDKLEKFKIIPIKIVPWKLETEWKELSKIDIGIMPLPDNEWTKGKSALKLLQYMALSIPSVGSNVGVNKEVIINGKNGFLPKNKKEWERYLEILILNKMRRIKIGKAGRKVVEDKYSLKENTKKILDIINNLN